MSTLHCPLCGLRFRFGSELDVHAREDHGRPSLRHLTSPRPRADHPEDEPLPHVPG